MNTVTQKIVDTGQYLNTKKLVLVYGELCRQANKHPDVNFSARFDCAKELIKQGVKVRAFARYSKQGVYIVCSVKQESRLISDGWVKVS